MKPKKIIYKDQILVHDKIVSLLKHKFLKKVLKKQGKLNRVFPL